MNVDYHFLSLSIISQGDIGIRADKYPFREYKSNFSTFERNNLSQILIEKIIFLYYTCLVRADTTEEVRVGWRVGTTVEKEVIH